MLALTRKKGDSIIVGDNVEIFVLGIQGDPLVMLAFTEKKCMIRFWRKIKRLFTILMLTILKICLKNLFNF